MFQRLKNIEDTNLTQLQAIKDQGEKQLIKLKNIYDSRMLEVIDEITELDTAELVSTKANGKTKYDFNVFKSSLKFPKKIYNCEITLDEAIEEQEKLENSIIRLENYKPRGEKRREK